MFCVIFISIHAIPYFLVGIICGLMWGSLAVRDHLRSNLEIICGLVTVPCELLIFPKLVPVAANHHPVLLILRTVLIACVWANTVLA